MMTRHRRSASTYVMVLGSGMIVMVIGLSALTATRVQRNAAKGDDDLVQARLNARTALEIGLQKMGEIANWRNQFPNGAWYVNQPFAGGTFSLNGVDPTDANLADEPGDPVLLTGVGQKGVARYQLQVTVNAEVRGLSCLEAALHAGGDVQFTNINLVSDGIVSANGNVAASGSTVDAAVEAVGTISGTAYARTTAEGITARDMPDPVDVFDYYLTNGTTIAINSIPDGGGNLLTNPGFESGTTDWLNRGNCTLAMAASTPHGGLQNLSFTGTPLIWSGPGQNITAQLSASGTTYHNEAWVRLVGGVPADVRIRIETVGSTSGTRSFGVVSLSVGSTWTLVSGDLTPTWTGTLTQAQWIVESHGGLLAVSVDDTVLSRSGAGRTIRSKVLSPSSNPFGSTNAEGIYVIDCGGQDLFIEDSQIIGTLVLVNPGSGSKITGPTNWQPAVENFPVLMVSGNMQIRGRTFVAPSPTNSITGLVYTTGNLSHIDRNVNFSGAVIVGGSFTASAANGSYTYNSVYLDDPPPGFNEQPQMVVQPGSWRPLVN